METLKRTCLGSLPPTLVIHLKRFELNYDTFLKQKVNMRCEFPMELDVFPYTVEGLTAAEAGGSPRNAPTCVYQLKGVLVHAGTANSGHYYSFVKEREDGEGGEEADLTWLSVCAHNPRTCVETCRPPPPLARGTRAFAV